MNGRYTKVPVVVIFRWFLSTRYICGDKEVKIEGKWLGGTHVVGKSVATKLGNVFGILE